MTDEPTSVPTSTPEAKPEVTVSFTGAINQTLTVPVGTKLSDIKLGDNINLANYVLRNSKNGHMISAAKYEVGAEIGITTKDKAGKKPAVGDKVVAPPPAAVTPAATEGKKETIAVAAKASRG